MLSNFGFGLEITLKGVYLNAGIHCQSVVYSTFSNIYEPP